MWGQGRLDIAGTKAIARLYTLGGAEWFVTVLVERLLGLVYSTDLDRATAAVFSLLHIDLVPCSLALLMHTLPRCMVGEGREQLLVHPGASASRASPWTASPPASAAAAARPTRAAAARRTWRPCATAASSRWSCGSCAGAGRR